MPDDSRIEQFKQMALADPDNELGHFSLGKAYLEAGKFDEAVQPLARTIELNPKLSKAYQLLGEAHVGAGQNERAIDTLTKGLGVADRQGDRMPRDAMADQLRGLGAPVPEFATSQPAVQDSSGSTTDATDGFRCSRCGRPGGKLEKRPFKGELGEKVFANVCTSCWREWIPMGTKVINELGLTLSSPAGQQAYDQYMVEFLQLEDR